jgi:kinesin family protein 1
MNATSSRAHTVVTIHFDQIITTSHGETKKMSVINLVDLAGKRILYIQTKRKNKF